MKRFSLMTTALFIALFATVSLAQTKTGTGTLSVDDQVMQLTKAFEDAYNRADHQGIADLFTTDAERTDADGNTVAGSANIGNVYKEAFSKAKWTVMIRHESAARVEPGTVIGTGSWKATGTNPDGTTVTRSGTYRNEIAVQDKRMRIRKMKVNSAL